MKNRLLATAAVVALVAGMTSASAQITGQPQPQFGTPKQDEQPQQKQKSEQRQHPATGQIQQQPEQKTGQPRQRTEQPGSGLGAGNRPEPRNQAGERQQRREQIDERQGRREQANAPRDRREVNRNGHGWESFSEEQRSRIRTGFHRADRMPNANFSISVGGSVPRYVHTYPVPREVWEVWPTYRRYVYILVGDEIIVINPRTNQIVAVLPA